MPGASAKPQSDLQSNLHKSSLWTETEFYQYLVYEPCLYCKGRKSLVKKRRDTDLGISPNTPFNEYSRHIFDTFKISNTLLFQLFCSFKLKWITSLLPINTASA